MIILLFAVGYFAAAGLISNTVDAPQIILNSPYVNDYDCKVSCSVIAINDQLPATVAKAGDIIHYRLVVTNIGKKDLTDITIDNHLFDSSIKYTDTLRPGYSWAYDGTQILTQDDIDVGMVMQEGYGYKGEFIRNDFVCAIPDLSTKQCAYAVALTDSSSELVKLFNTQLNGSALVQPDNTYAVKKVTDPDTEVGGDYHDITVYDRATARDPTYDEVIAFMWKDISDQEPYITDSFVCADFSEQIQHNAATQGLRCGWVGIEMENNDNGHACNAFNTTDKGLVFVDCTRGISVSNHGDQNIWDTFATIEVGKTYTVINA